MTHLLAHIWKKLNMPKGLQLFIMRFINDAFLVGVTGIILNENDEVLLLKHTYRQTPWSLPGGYLKKGEHPVKGIEREVLEETGFQVKIDKIIRTWHDPTTARLDITCYGTFVGGTFTTSSEVNDFGFFAYNQLPQIDHRQKKLIEKTLISERGHLLPRYSFLQHFQELFSVKIHQ